MMLILDTFMCRLAYRSAVVQFIAKESLINSAFLYQHSLGG
jgi:hypothetical protein